MDTLRGTTIICSVYLNISNGPLMGFSTSEGKLLMLFYKESFFFF